MIDNIVLPLRLVAEGAGLFTYRKGYAMAKKTNQLPTWDVVPLKSRLRGPSWDVVDSTGEIIANCTLEHHANYIASLHNEKIIREAVVQRLDPKQKFRVEFSVPDKEHPDGVWLQYNSPPFLAHDGEEARGMLTSELLAKGHKEFTLGPATKI